MKKGTKVTSKPAATKVDNEEKKRIDFENNQELISSTFFSLITKSGKIPTMTRLTKETGLCYKTIQRHLATPSFNEMKERLRSFNSQMLVQFVNKVSKSTNPAMWDMYWKLTEPEYADAVSKKKVDVTTKGQPIQTLAVQVVDEATKNAISEL